MQASTLNPYRELLAECGVSPREFAAWAKLSSHAVEMILSGSFRDLSDNMVDRLGALCRQNGVPFDADKLRAGYKAWQSKERAESAQAFNRIKPQTGDETISPFLQYVKDTSGSVNGFASDLKVTNGAVYQYATGIVRKMPISISEAFEEIGYPWLSEMRQRQEKWRDAHGRK